MSSPPLPPLAAPLGPATRQGNTTFAVSVALLMLRLALGWTFIYHGSQKVFGAFGGKGMEDFTIGLSQLPIPKFLPPAVWAYLAAYGELIGGITIFLGLLTRLGTLPIIVIMLVAIATVHCANGFSGPGGFEFHINLIAMCVALLVAGPGIISLDALLFRRGFWARGPQPLGEAAARTTRA